MYVVTVALDKPGSVVVFSSISDPQHCVNRQRSTALGAVKSDEPSLAAAATSCQIEVSLENNKEGSIILGFIEGTILQQKNQNSIIGFLVYLNDIFHPVRIPVDKNIPSFVNAHS